MPHVSRRNFLALGGAMAGVHALGVVVAGDGTALGDGAARTWVDRCSYGPFQCQATFPLGSYSPMFQELSALERELQRTLAVPSAKRPIDIYLFSDERTHRDFLARLYPRVPYRRAIYVQRGGQGSVFAYRQSELAIDLRHECTHALLHANLAMVPLWLDEGLAEYFEMPEPQRAFHHPHLSKLRWNLRLGMVRNVAWLEQKQALNDMGSVEYRFSWAWVHFMLHGPVAAHRVLVHYFADIRQGNPPGQLSEHLRRAVPQLEKRMVQHFKHWRS